MRIPVILPAVVAVWACAALATRRDPCVKVDDPGVCNLNYVFRHDAHRGNYEAWVALHDHQCFFLGQYNRVEQYEPLTSLLPHMISFSNKGTTANASDVEFWYFTDHYKGGFRECVQTDSGTHACWRHFDCHWDVLPDDHFPEY